jgi:hypothetical protein
MMRPMKRERKLKLWKKLKKMMRPMKREWKMKL